MKLKHQNNQQIIKDVIHKSDDLLEKELRFSKIPTKKAF
jgi:hypothetical protein